MASILAYTILVPGLSNTYSAIASFPLVKESKFVYGKFIPHSSANLTMSGSNEQEERAECLTCSQRDQ